MLVRHWHEEPVEELTPLLGRQLLHTETITIGRIILAAGAVVPSHHHVHEQVANVLAGRLRFEIGGEELVVSAGESVFIPSASSATGWPKTGPMPSTSILRAKQAA